MAIIKRPFETGAYSDSSASDSESEGGKKSPDLTPDLTREWSQNRDKSRLQGQKINLENKRKAIEEKFKLIEKEQTELNDDKECFFDGKLAKFMDSREKSLDPEIEPIARITAERLLRGDVRINDRISSSFNEDTKLTNAKIYNLEREMSVFNRKAHEYNKQVPREERVKKFTEHLSKVEKVKPLSEAWKDINAEEAATMRKREPSS